MTLPYKKDLPHYPIETPGDATRICNLLIMGISYRDALCISDTEYTLLFNEWEERYPHDLDMVQ